MKNRGFYFLIAAFVFLLVAVGALAIFLVVRDTTVTSKDIYIEANGTTQQNLVFSSLSLDPGEETSYSVYIMAKKSGTYSITLTFDEITDGGLKNYVNAELECGGKRVIKPLYALFEDGDTTTFNCLLTAYEKTAILVRFSVPDSAGNETQRLTADFNILLTAKAV